MDELDRLYGRMLQAGLLVLNQALDAGDVEWAKAETQLLHNVPSLLGEENAERHAYFWNEERDQYLEWMAQHGSELARSRMRTYYEPVWDEMEPLVVERTQAVQQP
jgi:hypothetical protein